MKLIAWMIQEIFWMLNQSAVEIPTIPVSTSVIPTSSRSWWNAKPFYRNAELQRRAKQLGHMEIRETFLQIQMGPLQHLIRRSWIDGVPEESERQTKTQDQRCQSGQSAKSSVIFSGGDSFKELWADQQRLQISDLHFDKFPTLATFACWRIRFKIEVCTCSQFLTEALHWIKEVEIVDSVDDLMSSSSFRGILMPNFEVLDARIASALNRIIHNSHLTRRIIPAGPFLSWKTDRFLDLWVLVGHRSQRFCREFCRPVHCWSSKWRCSGIRFKVGRNFIVHDEDPTWWNLGRIVEK